MRVMPEVSFTNSAGRVAAQFGLAATSYPQHARLQRHAAARLMAWLPRQLPWLVDLGTGPLWYREQLQRHCDQLLALDLSWSMLAQASAQGVDAVQGDATLLPLLPQSLDALYSSLMLQWCAKPELVLQQVAHALKPGAVAVFSTLLQGTLTELEHAWAQLDSYRHINEFLPLQYFQQLRPGLDAMGVTVTLESELVQLPYATVRELARELKGLGANTVLGERRHGLTGKGYWQQLEQNYPRRHGELLASYQLLYIRLERR